MESNAMTTDRWTVTPAHASSARLVAPTCGVVTGELRLHAVDGLVAGAIAALPAWRPPDR